jgi:type I site-specific restriction endonuclease
MELFFYVATYKSWRSQMNEAETRAELIDPKLRANGWGVVEDSKILRERNVCKITDGRIQVGGDRKKPLIAELKRSHGIIFLCCNLPTTIPL